MSQVSVEELNRDVLLDTGHEVPHVKLAFKDLEYSVSMKKERKKILCGVNGEVASKNMLCVLGPSGGGKTSLIQIIAGKITSSATKSVTGSVTCNDQVLTSSQFQRIAGLVTQEDVFNAALTVQETLSFMARLKLPSSGRQERIAEVVRLLQLDNCLKTYVGDDSNPYLKGISGGEKRRLAIATEILDPQISVLVLDEPTSGLDAASALNVAKLLRSLADKSPGIAVVASLHQPRDSIMSLFDQLMIMDKGRRAYYGSVAEYVPYLENEMLCSIPAHDSPYDLILDMLNPAIGLERTTVGAIPDDCTDLSKAFADKYSQSSLCKRMDDAKASDPEVRTATVKELAVREFTVSWCSKFWTILLRTFLIKARDPIVLATQISSAVMMGLIFGTIYWGCYEKEAQFVILDTQMAITMTVVMLIFLPYDVTLTFPKERQIFLRERRAGLYSTSAFYFARITADMPMHMLAAAVMCLIVYPMCGLRMGVHWFLIVGEVGILVGAALMQMIGAVSRTFEEANILMMLILMLSMVLSTGFVREVPSWLQWGRDISVMGINGDIAMYFEFRNIDAEFGTTESVFTSFGVQIKNEELLGRAMLINLGIYLVARAITYLAIKFLHTGRSFRENLAD